ncbi:CRISPR-associated protein [Marinicrinis sediminis]|uniref:CRISPR-associated protein n=1 Tax=Marinicrinis sediminis TaxID=1652465 RepID=A0ABW5R7Z4_9BACL
MPIHSGEILFIKSAKDGIPNRDPLNDSDARRLFPEEDGRISLSDVSIKRDVRDYVLSVNEDSPQAMHNQIFVQQIMNDKGNLLGRKSLAELIAQNVGKEKEAKKDMKSVLLEHSFDVRTFGIVYSVNPKFHLTGPVQFGWAHSMHPVDSHYVQGTVVMPSKDVSNNSGGDEEGKTQGTIWTSYTVPFAVFAMPAVINAKNAEHTQMTPEDQELLLKGLWQGTQLRQARGRGQQQPLFLLHVEYRDPHFRIGYLEDYVSLHLLNEDQQWGLNGKQPSSTKDISLDIGPLLEVLEQYSDKIANCRIWVQPTLQVKGDMTAYQQPLW